MNEELLVKAMKMFDTSEKWNAFSELASKQIEIRNRWWRDLRKEVVRREQKDGMPDWEVGVLWDLNFRWYMKGEINGENENTLSIHFWIHDKVSLRVSFGFGGLDQDKVRKLYASKFDVIKAGFDRVDETALDTIGREIGNFSFGSIYDGNFPDNTTLSWYAGKETKEFANQIIAKVRKFQTSEITDLFKEINEKCRKE